LSVTSWDQFHEKKKIKYRPNTLATFLCSSCKSKMFPIGPAGSNSEETGRDHSLPGLGERTIEAGRMSEQFVCFFSEEAVPKS
jgi:hypothetical protein